MLPPLQGLFHGPSFPYTGSNICGREKWERLRLRCFNFPFYKRDTKVKWSDMYAINFPRKVIQSCWTLVANSVLEVLFLVTLPVIQTTLTWCPLSGRLLCRQMIWVLLIVFVNMVQGCTVKVTRTERHKRFFPSSMLWICLQIGAQPPSTSQQFHNI